MAQTYHDPQSVDRMRRGLCPECGQLPEAHSTDIRFWIPRLCDITLPGVNDRIAQQRELDIEKASEAQ